MFKFEIGEIVKKSKGYKFEGKVVSRYEVEGGIRYDVQVDSMPIFEYVRSLYESGVINAGQYGVIGDYVMNCHGMIHIFAEEQLESCS